MAYERVCFACATMLWLCFSVARAQDAGTVIQQAVQAELSADQTDHSNWTYLEETRQPKEHLVQWVTATQHGSVRRVLRRNDQSIAEAEQRDAVQKFLHDEKAQKKQAEDDRHDDQQVDDLLKLLPVAFRWTQTSATAQETVLHFEPDPAFHPPTREARVFAEMVGDLAVDKEQHRIHRMSGHLVHDVLFGGGLLGRLKAGSSFSLEQAQVGPSLWQLTGIQVQLNGNALLFKSISLQQESERSKYKQEPPNLTLQEAGDAVLQQPDALPAAK